MAPLHPLAQFYRSAGRPLPEVETIPASAVPPAAAAVLVHDREMTTQLEGRHRTTVGIRVLARMHANGVYARQVLLTRIPDATPLALAAVELRLDALPAEARAALLAEETPLGAIVRRSCSNVRRVHDRYFRLRPDQYVRSALGLDGAGWAYGRRGVLVTGPAAPFADVIEIVVP